MKGQPTIKTFLELKKTPVCTIGLDPGFQNNVGIISQSYSTPCVVEDENLLGKKTTEAENLTGEQTTQLQDGI